MKPVTGRLVNLLTSLTLTLVLVLVSGCVGQPPSRPVYPDTLLYRRCVYQADVATAPMWRTGDVYSNLHTEHYHWSLVEKCVRGDDRRE